MTFLLVKSSDGTVGHMARDREAGGLLSTWFHVRPTLEIAHWPHERVSLCVKAEP